MNWQTYKIEIVTPCFCAGAKQLQAEIRVPSIRGQLRWWFRALGGTREEEQAIFGGVHGKAASSAVVLRVENPPTSTVAMNLNTLPIKDDYLYWPLRPGKHSDQKRGVLLPDTTFQFSLAWRRLNDDEKLKNILDVVVQLWILLGAIGTRSRRAAGSLWPVENAPQNIEELKAKIIGLMKTIPNPSMQVFVLKEDFGNLDGALRYTGNWLKQWRAGSTRSVSSPKRWGKNDHDAGLKESDIVYRPALGLPLMQRYTGAKLTAETLFNDGDRWASPLHLKIIRLANRYCPCVVYFPHHVIPENSRLLIKEKRSRAPGHAVRLRHDLIDEMLGDLTPVYHGPTTKS
ncbi:MAG: type III-B CRISPR module RAMP protein Cmr1 [Kiritimatiellia bacterium]|jgi:CRISPR-associated protein Cmr1